jgi:sec-independent protein translocase protein TatA
MFGIGTSELLIILLIVLLVFGASRLPKLGKGLGEGLRSFKDAVKGEDDKPEIDADKKSDSNKPV